MANRRTGHGQTARFEKMLLTIGIGGGVAMSLYAMVQAAMHV